MDALQHGAVWILCGISMAGVVLRPRGSSETLWALLGACALTACGLIPLHDALAAIGRGADVYAFLAGMMMLAELLRALGFFDWIATAALARSRASAFALFAYVYAAGIAVTALLSNDATAVVLTPAIVAVLKKTKANPLPYAFAGALVANAASFILPMSNPANLVVYDGALPSLLSWINRFAFASFVAVIVTFVMLALRWRSVLSRERLPQSSTAKFNRSVKLAAALFLLAVVVLCTISFREGDIGVAALIVGALACALTACVRREPAVFALKHVHWSMLPFVAGLFVIMTALDQSGALALCAHLLSWASKAASPVGSLGIATFVTLASSALNNLPLALAAAPALNAASASPHVRGIWLIAVDLGPNLAAAGSLSTLLWMKILRREGIKVTPLAFLSVGALALPPALVLTVLAAR